MAKIAASDALWQASDDLVEMLGGRGYMENNPAPQILRDCRMLRIGEGANELMTLSVGRRVNHSERLHAFLRDRLGCPELSEQLKDVSRRVQERCLLRGAPFADRSAALSWAFTLIGRVSIRGTVMASARAAARRSPSDLLHRAAELASLRFEAELDEALRGHASESFLMGPAAITAAVAGYVDAIGDLEPAPPGVEEAIDPLLRRDPTGGGFPALGHLPGNVVPGAIAHDPAAEVEALTPEQKRRLAAQLLLRRQAARAKFSARGPGGRRRLAVLIPKKGGLAPSPRGACPPPSGALTKRGLAPSPRGARPRFVGACQGLSSRSQEICPVSIATPAQTRESIEAWLIDWIARELGLPPADVQTSRSLLDYSLSSVTAMMLVGDLEEWLGLTLPPTLVWDYPSIAAIADFLLEQLRMEAVAGPDADGLAASPVDGLAALDGLSDREVDELLGRMLASQGPSVAS